MTERVLRLSVYHCFNPDKPEAEVHEFVTNDHAVKAAKIHQKHGLLGYTLVWISLLLSLVVDRNHLICPMAVLRASKCPEGPVGLEEGWRTELGAGHLRCLRRVLLHGLCGYGSYCARPGLWQVARG